ncbi:MAG: amidohydrolase [Planctomycetia bacterium]|nr:amidohydrolase [Planctomycetia bacterium]
MKSRLLIALLGTLLCCTAAAAQDADLILHNGKVVTVDRKFSIHQALAVRGGKVLKVGGNAEVLKTRGPTTQVVDLAGKTVLPGLIDSHVHPTGAAMHEFDHVIPDMESIQDVLDYVRARAKVVPEGGWIKMRQIFITRLKEQRYPTRAELDEAAPKHPVIFATGPDASLNSLALQANKIDKAFKPADPAHVPLDPKTGEPTGIIRSYEKYVRTGPSGGKEASEADRIGRQLELFRDYNAVGLTGIIDRDASGGAIGMYQKLRDQDALTLRVAISHSIGTSGAAENVQKSIRQVAEHPLRKPDPLLRIIGIKTYLDGGMLTGSAYMRQPWGISKIYSIDDPKYQGLLYISKDRLKGFVQAAVESGLQYTAHSVGDGAVHTLLDVYEDLSKSLDVRKTRPCLTHSNFMSQEAIAQCAKLGVVVDIQPAWLYLDARTLSAQFGNDRLRYFQPLKSLLEAGVIAGGGSDHMQKIGSFRSVNPYNPFLGIQTTITRKARWYEGGLHPEEALSREQALRFYTSNNAHLMFLEDQTGSLEEGKLADLIVIDRDILTCPEETIKDTQVLRTYLGGKLVFEKK